MRRLRGFEQPTFKFIYIAQSHIQGWFGRMYKDSTNHHYSLWAGNSRGTKISRSHINVQVPNNIKDNISNIKSQVLKKAIYLQRKSQSTRYYEKSADLMIVQNPTLLKEALSIIFEVEQKYIKKNRCLTWRMFRWQRIFWSYFLGIIHENKSKCWSQSAGKWQYYRLKKEHLE